MTFTALSAMTAQLGAHSEPYGMSSPKRPSMRLACQNGKGDPAQLAPRHDTGRSPNLVQKPLVDNLRRDLPGGRANIVNDDIVELALQSHSHWDALAHWGVVEPSRRARLLPGELFDLEALVAHARLSGQREFAFTSAPLNIPHAFGSPANAMAIV